MNRLSRRLLPLIHGLAAHDGSQDFSAYDLLRRGGGYVAIEHHKVGEHPRNKVALFFLLELGIRRTSGVGRDGLIHGETVRWKIFLLAIFTFSGNRGVEPTEWTNRLDRIIRSKRE